MLNVLENTKSQTDGKGLGKILSKFSLKNIKSKKWSKPVAEALSVTSSIAEGAGALGVPFAGLVGLALKMGAGVLKTDKVEEVKTFIETHYEEISQDVAQIQEGIEELKDLVRSSFELLADSCYRDGMMSIEAAFDTFMDVTNLGFQEKIMEFRSHKFELEKEYRHFLNPAKVEEYLSIVFKQRGIVACVDMFDYVITVEAKFLQMFVLFHIYCNNMEGVINQFNLFNRHFMDISRRFTKLVSTEDKITEYKYNTHTYKEVTALSIACITNKPGEVLKLVRRCRANLEHKVSRVNRHKGRRDLTGVGCLLLAAENGNVEVCRVLVSELGCSPNTTADNGFTAVFSAAQFGHLGVVQLLAELGADLHKGAGLATPYFVAVEYGHTQVATFLKNMGCV